MYEELKPVNCGCGGEAKLICSRKICIVMCKNCGISTLADNEEKAVTTWNRAMCDKDINVPDKETVIVEPLGNALDYVGTCLCGDLVSHEWHYCPNCGRKIQWGMRYV